MSACWSCGSASARRSLQAGLIKAFDFDTTVAVHGATAVAASEVRRVHGDGRGDARRHRPAARRAHAVGGVRGARAMLDAWAVNVSGAAFWSEPFNVPFLIGVGAAALLFTGAGAYSVDARLLGRPTLVRAGYGRPARCWRSPRRSLTWVALNGMNPIHFSRPDQLTLLAGRPNLPGGKNCHIFRNVTQRTLNGDGYCSVHVDRRHQC